MKKMQKFPEFLLFLIVVFIKISRNFMPKIPRPQKARFGSILGLRGWENIVNSIVLFLVQQQQQQQQEEEEEEQQQQQQ